MNLIYHLIANGKSKLIAVVVMVVVFSGLVTGCPAVTETSLTADQFRNLTIEMVRSVADNYYNGLPLAYLEALTIRGNWEISITVYHQGEVRGEGQLETKDEMLSAALEQVTREALENTSNSVDKDEINQVRFVVTFTYPQRQSFSIIEYDGSGRELLTGLVINRTLDRQLLIAKINDGKEFLLRAVHRDEHGFYKRYEPLTNDWGDRLHTVYSASIIYTLLRIYDFDSDPRILAGLADWGDFLLDMQNRDEATYGAFHYSYYFDSQVKQPRFVVGTAALSIFTLLDLYNRTGETKYLESARLAGNWLITMQQADGWIRPYMERRDGQWIYGEDISLLYNGQVLSALSRLYTATGEEGYYHTAEEIAQQFTTKVEREGCYLGDDYRTPNPISSAWVVMALIDFYQVSQQESYRDIILKCSTDLYKRQQLDANDLLHYGTWERAYSTSGNGWLAEVMATVYQFYQAHNLDGSEKYRQAVIDAVWWIIQNTYSAENTFFLKEPQLAIGGIFWNHEEKYVRTDSLCHAVNAYISLAVDYSDGQLLTIPEPAFDRLLAQLMR